jgi:hypothetical protein
LAIIASVAHRAVRLRLRVAGGEEIGRAEEADPHLRRRIEHLRDAVAKRLHHRSGPTLQDLQDPQPGDVQPLGRREDVDASLGERQQHRVYDALVVLAAVAILGMAAGHGLAEAVVV